jgi:hypothetical protein
MAAELHLAENALTLHLFLERLEGLIDVVVTDYDLQVLPLNRLNWICGALDEPRAWAAG